MMLGRKQSLRQTVTASLAATAAGLMGTGTGTSVMLDGSGGLGSGGLGGGAGAGLGPGAAAAAAAAGLELEECIHARIMWWESAMVRRFMRFCAFLSLVSVSLNTSYTFNRMASLLYITFVIDLFVAFVFAIEFVSKVKIRGSRNYFHDRWAQFDAIMLLCLIMSLVLHVFEILGYVQNFSPLSMIRAPRPLIMVRLVRVFLSFSMPRARITQIFLRSSQQIYNVTLFFLFFMSLFGLLGVQFFSRLHHHCVLQDNYTLGTHEPSIHQLAIPDTYCSPVTTHGHQCPSSMICIEIYNSSGYAGFDNLAHALFTVYQSASQEGWSHVMYQAMDSLDMFRAAFYFVTLIFFLAWLVKNVFIAVITETFNEIRVQFQQMWGERAQISTETMPSILVGDDRWRLIQVTDTDTGTKAPYFIRKILGTASFQISVMLVIVMNAIVNASIKFDHSGRPREHFYLTIYPAEVFFTIIFDIEVILKIWCYGFRSYIRRSLHKLELLLSIGSTAHILPPLYMTPPLVYFQVLRIVRLIKASPVLEDFVYKIFGPGKKLGSLIIFTMCLLIVTSSISMQLFCCFAGYNKFQSFPEAFMSMFQILTQEGWTEVMNETILRSGRKIGPLVAIYFILYHLFVSLIVLSLFVAVILDNLELDEDIKKVKQLKAREQSAGFNEELPLRLRLFESFPDSPQMTRLHKSANEFSIPKVRDSFMRCFIDSSNTIANTVPTGTTSAATVPYVGNYNFSTNSTSMIGGGGVSVTGGTGRPIAYNGYLTASSKPLPSSLNSSGVANTGSAFVSLRKQAPIKLLSSISKGRHSSPLLRRVQVACIVSDSNNQRLLLGDGSGLPGGAAGGFTRGVGGVGTAAGGRSMRRSVRGTLKEEVGTEESQSTGTGPTVRGQDFDFKMLQRKRQQAEMRRTQRESDLRENHPFFDTPLLLVGRESRFRLICQSIVSAKYDPHVRDPITGKERKVRYKGTHELLGLVPYCDWLMIVVTTVSCASMMCETGEMRVSNTPALIIAEYTFVTAMAIELTLKTMADGLLFTPNAYLANVAGVMDFSIFAVSVFFLLVLPEHVPPQSWQQTLMVLRCVRPLRIFSLVPHMRKVVYELCRGFKEIALVSVLLIVLLFVFASVGVHMFGGLLARCNDPCIAKRRDCVGVFMRPVHVTRMKLEHQTEHMPAVLVPRVWANPSDFDFDSIGNAFLALFEILSLEGYDNYRDIIIDRTSILDAIYIHVFVFLGCMIGLTLFVGVVIANYGENKGTALLTVDQRRWCDLKKRLKIAQPLHLPPRPDHHQGRAIIYDITQHIAFKRFIALLVLANSSLLCVSWDTSMSHTVPLANFSAIFTGFFVFEVLMKMIAFTPRGYWQSRRNRYDLFVTVLGVFWLILHFTLMNQTSNAFGFIVVILRFFTITGKHATLKMLMLTVAVSVYKSFFIIMGLFLLILCYALAGVILFGSVKFGENISRHANFRTAPLGVITLFRIVTGEDWNKIMHDAMLSPPFCTPGPNFWSTDCGNYYASLTFFCSFYVCITYIVLNLLVAIIMENFSLFYSNEEDALLSYADIRNFQNTWNLVDLQQRGMIPISRVKFVLRLLKGRLEVDPNKDRLLFKHMCHEMERLHNGEDVTFHDVLNMLSYRSVDIRKSLQLEELLAREELEFLIEEEVAKATIRAWLDKCLRRIKKERQHQSLMHSLRATNEQPVSSFLSGLSGGGGTDFDAIMGLGPFGGLQQSPSQSGVDLKADDPFGQSKVSPVTGKDGANLLLLEGKLPGAETSGDDASGAKVASRFKTTKETHHKPAEHHHHHKRVEFRHVEERSKKSTEDNLANSGGAQTTGTLQQQGFGNNDDGAGTSASGIGPSGVPQTPSTLSSSGSISSASRAAASAAARKGITKQQLTLTIPEEEERIKEPKMSNIWNETGSELGVSGPGPGCRKLTPLHTPTTEIAPRFGDPQEHHSKLHHHPKKRTTFQQPPSTEAGPSGQKTSQQQHHHHLTEPAESSVFGTNDDGNGSNAPAGRRFLSLHSYPPTSSLTDEGPYSPGGGISCGPSTSAAAAAAPSDSGSRSPMIKHLSKEPTAHLGGKSSLRTVKLSEDVSPISPSQPDGTATAANSLAEPSTSKPTFSKRLLLHRQNSDGVLVGAITGSAIHQKRMHGREQSDSLESSGSLALNDDTLDGGGTNAGATAGTNGGGGDRSAIENAAKKFNLIRAQIMVNEVHDWWMLHLS